MENSRSIGVPRFMAVMTSPSTSKRIDRFRSHYQLLCYNPEKDILWQESPRDWMSIKVSARVRVSAGPMRLRLSNPMYNLGRQLIVGKDTPVFVTNSGWVPAEKLTINSPTPLLMYNKELEIPQFKINAVEIEEKKDRERWRSCVARPDDDLELVTPVLDPDAGYFVNGFLVRM